jgi:signal transduction histidine kinase
MSVIDWETILPPWLRSSLPVGVLVTDTELAIRYWSPWLERHSGLTATKVVGNHLFECFPDMRERGMEAPFHRALTGAETHLLQPEHSYLLPFPTVSPYPQFERMQQVARVGPLEVDGAIVGTLCTIADETERAIERHKFELQLQAGERLMSQQAEEAARRFAETRERARLYELAEHSRAAAEEALRLRDALFSIAAHELRTPLTTLLGRAQLLQKWLVRDERTDERNLRTIGIVVSQAQRLNAMITSLLDVSRIQSGRFTIAPLPMSLTALVRRVVEEFQPGLASHSLQFEAGDDPLVIHGDELRLEQVLQGLISNAVKYSPEGGEVLVRVIRGGDKAQVLVSDEGIGIPKAEQHELFHRFFRAENAEAHGIGGLGIGLFVASEILELHGGRISVESAEGKGSTFKVELPLAAAQSPGA